MTAMRWHLILRFAIGSVWFINGLVCKVMMLVPRHHDIVATILGDAHALLITRAIGLGEMALAVWVWSGIRAKFCAFVQGLLVAAMNILEFFLAKDLLLWGSGNALFALLFILLVWWNAFVMTPSRIPAE